ncbi:Nif3-like dinuclear metal center hexameric protein [Caldisericum sp.]|uniref:Nif3-like dinuclear metal center hexameric protein n=1 Tax=Caldisericum sp. TaxID=2499687 RepID=UPI003D0FFB83
MKVKELIYILNEIAPFFLQEDYDNSGLQFGDLDSEALNILIALDLQKSVVEEAKALGVKTIITHHPVIFKAIKNIEKGKSEAFYEAITNGINIISFHTNFDIAENGLNDYFLNLLGIKKEKPIIQSKEKVYKVATYVPKDFVEKVRVALFEGGAGHIGNYDECSFNVEGIGTFRPLENSNPFIGEKNKREFVNEVRIEVVVRERDLSKALYKLRQSHPYEEPAIDVFEILFEKNEGIGAIGTLEIEQDIVNFVKTFKEKTNTSYVRYIGDANAKISKVAICTGACGSIFESVINNAELFITGDIGYHTALAIKERGLNVLDVEHFETEKFFKNALFVRLKNYIDPSNIKLSTSEKSPFNLI